MEKGKKLCGNEKASILRTILTTVVLLIVAHVLLPETEKLLITIILLTCFFGALPILMIRLFKPRHDFHEHGVVYYEKNKPIHFEPYENFTFIEFYIEESFSNRGKNRYYYLAFWPSDSDCTKLRRAYFHDLERAWNKILISHPHLRNQLRYHYVDDYSESLYNLLKNNRYEKLHQSTF